MIVCTFFPAGSHNPDLANIPKAPASKVPIACIDTSDPSSVDPLVLYATGISSSNYVANVGPLVATHVSGDLLDIGSGGGQLGNAVRAGHHRWTVVEPSLAMIERTTRFSPSQVFASGWESANIGEKAHDTVLAANIAAPVMTARPFLQRCRQWSRKKIVWVVPAQNGPRGLCLAGCLPAEWHKEDETPGIDIVLAQLSSGEKPSSIDFVDWTFSLVVSDIRGIGTYLADRLNWPSEGSRRRELAAHLTDRARPSREGYRLDVPRKSAVLAWSI